MKDTTFPWLYHGQYSQHKEDLSFWLNLAHQSGGPILELACGTGRVLGVLIQAGYKVFGLDRDESMLDVLEETITEEVFQSLQVFQADMAAFHLHKQFPLIVLTCNTFGTISYPTRQATLTCVCRHLLPGGIFATSLPNPEALRDLPEKADPEFEEAFYHPISGNPVEVSCGWQRFNDHIIFHWIYDHLFPDGRVERVIKDAYQDLSSKEDFELQVNQAGLSLDGVMGDFNGDEYDSDSPNLILIARRQ